MDPNHEHDRAHDDDLLQGFQDQVDALEALVTQASERADRLDGEVDALQARIDAYEGNLEEWEEMRRLIKGSSLGTPEVQARIADVPTGVGKAITLGAEYLARAEDAEEKLGGLLGAVIFVMRRLQEMTDELRDEGDRDLADDVAGVYRMLAAEIRRHEESPEKSPGNPRA